MHPLYTERGTAMNLHLETIPPCPVAKMGRTGPYGAENAALMEKMKSWARLHSLMGADSVLYAIAWDNPQTTQPEDCRYDVCLVLPQGLLPPDGDMTLGRIAGGRYAVAVLPHTPEGVAEGWDQLFPALSQLGVQPDPSRPILERYAARMIQSHQCELCVPIL
ncbi:AraC family transcriptional regulator [Merdimmobilis hominis]